MCVVHIKGCLVISLIPVTHHWVDFLFLPLGRTQSRSNQVMVPTVTLTGVGVLGRAQSFDDVKLGAPVLLLLFFCFVLFCFCFFVASKLTT